VASPRATYVPPARAQPSAYQLPLEPPPPNEPPPKPPNVGELGAGAGAWVFALSATAADPAIAVPANTAATLTAAADEASTVTILRIGNLLSG
jgi:hypothetical protein